MRTVWKCSLALLGCAALAADPALGALFVEDFNDGLAASRWSVASQQESTAAPTTGPDGSVDFAFDYSSLGISSPTGSGDTVGAFIQVNKTDQTGDEGESYIIFPTGGNFSAPFVLEADVFGYNDGLAGTTELAIAGAYLNNAAPVAPYQWGTAGGPLAWLYSNEGGSTADLAVFKEGGPAATGYAAINDYNNVPAGTIPGFETGVAGADGPSPAATAPRGSWVKVRVEASGATVKYYLNGALIDTYDNSGGFYTAGNVFFGATDPFNSVNAGGGTIVDNVVVTVPEPTTWALAGLSFVAWSAIRRR